MPKNLTSLEHAVVAWAIQCTVYALTGSWREGAAAGIFFFLGREHAQAEYRWITAYGKGLRANLPWWGGFDPKVWAELDPWLDWIAPIWTCCLLVYFLGVLK